METHVVGLVVLEWEVSNVVDPLGEELNQWNWVRVGAGPTVETVGRPSHVRRVISSIEVDPVPTCEVTRKVR